MATLIQLFVLVVWLAPTLIHGQRLLRLAWNGRHWPQRGPHNGVTQRLWWWLGRPEFWQAVQHDVLHCIQITLAVMVVIGLRV